MGYDAQELVRKLPREIKLTPSSRRLLDYFAWRANEKDFQKSGTYWCFPSEGTLLAELGFSRATLYRALDELEFRCGFYLITRGNRGDRRAALYDLHILTEDMKPSALLKRKQAADRRLSQARGKVGSRKRITSQNETYSLKITSQNETEYVSKRDVITSQNETETPKITSQNETCNKEYKRTRNLEQGTEQGGKCPPASKSREPSQSKYPRAVRAIIDKHAEMWAAAEQWLTHGFELPKRFHPGKSDCKLLHAAARHVGSTRFKGFPERPRDASFARDEFMDYLRDHDPAYEAAVGEAVAQSLGDKPKAKARAAPG